MCYGLERISYQGVGRLVFIEDTMTEAAFKQILSKNLRHSLMKWILNHIFLCVIMTQDTRQILLKYD
ncbi:hypothetical protein HERIO_1814 [Hepatospora eriocheir]|uniref:Uncharacterized protein n=1 Tax=Hepatospora eriocheir TaxID=1081669 RepID=A0A1X0Q961_9MICR|nr:hypothetical protein HERIO_1814 [Hepatospora eriocheir]